MNTLENSLKKLSIIGEAYSFSWFDLRRIYSLVVNEKAKIIKARWNDDFKNEYYPLNLDRLKDFSNTWSTYEDYIRISFLLKDQQLVCRVEIYDKDYEYLHNRKLRCISEFSLPTDEIDIVSMLSLAVESHWKTYCEDQYIEFLEETEKIKQKVWIEQFEKEQLEE